MNRADVLAPSDRSPADLRQAGIGAAMAASAAILACILTRLPDRTLRMAGIRGWIPGLVVVMALVNGVRGVAQAPFTYASSEQRLSRLAARSASTVGSAVGIGALLTVPLYAMLRATWLWWLWAWAFFALVTIAAQVLMPVVMRVRCGALHPAPPDLAAQVHLVEARAGLADRTSQSAADRPGGGVYVAAPGRTGQTQRNAYLLGLGHTRRIVLEAGLAEWPPDLVVQIVAHELGHARLHHTARRLPVTISLQFLTFFLAAAALSLTPLLRWAGAPQLGDPRSYPLLLLLTAAAVGPARIALAAYDRHQERAADRFALELLGDSGAYVEMLDRLGREGDAVRVLPWWRKLTATHPTIDQRIRECKSPKEYAHV